MLFKPWVMPAAFKQVEAEIAEHLFKGFANAGSRMRIIIPVYANNRALN